jgi:hypothetical protein
VIALRWLLPAIAALMAVELAVAGAQGADRRRRFLPTLCAGLFIVLAWNASALGGPWWLVLGLLGGALAAHAADLVLRW